MSIKPSKLVGTLDELQAVLNDPDISDITINSTISISENTVIDFNGKTVNVVVNFSRDSVFSLDAENIALTFKSSGESGGVVPVRLHQAVALVNNDNINNTVTFDEGFDVDYSEFENFKVIELSKRMTLNFIGANITSNGKISASSINISGGSITCAGEDTAVSIFSYGSFNMSGGKVRSNSENKVSIVFNSRVTANISGGTTGNIRINGDGTILKISGNAQIIDDSGCIYVPENSTNVSIEMNGGSIESSKGNGINNCASDSGSKINITGGIISANQAGIYSKCPVNISDGKIISKGTSYTSVLADGENAFVSISGGNLTSKGNCCVHFQNNAKGKVTGGIFEGYYAIGIADSNSGVIDEVSNATFNTDFDYGLLNGACVSLNGVTYKHTGESWSNIKVNLTDSDKTKIDSVDIRSGYVEVTDKSGVNILNAGDTYEYVKSFEKMISYWQAHLFTKYGLRYRAEILASLYFGLQTDKIIMLVGNPGTGKTTLVKYLAKTFDFEDAAIIPVQPNWTDKGDLLGYYNPLNKSYMATDFLETLIKFSRLAENQPEKFFIICLDEMNLAHIEYYFAEFLSALQTDRKISLYSESICENIQRELKIANFNADENAFLEMNVTERQYYLDLWRMYDTIKKFPPVLTIPPNVKFFGTLNQDETTLDVSPKVIDRAYIIRLEMSDADLNFDGDFEKTLEYRPIESYRKKYTVDLDANILKNSMNAVAPISYRLTDQILENDKFDTWQRIIGSKPLADFIISSCFLPKIRFNEDAYKIKIDALKDLCKGRILSEKILSDIDDGIEADFWRR